MSINLSDYPHSGIFIDENNNSVVDRPAPQEAIINFVPGFSKKGTVFNRPVLVKTKTDRNKYFGEIDRSLEKKHSFFHRTIETALQTGPVWAMNILKTNSLDQLNYQSISLAAQYDNDTVSTRVYDDFFNKAGFWQRDTESFLFFAASTQRMIHFTNLGDSPVSIFMYKSPLAGFNLTAEVWYGGVDKVPTWINKNDFISDYMVRVVVVKGNWNDYTALAADSYYAKYFTSAGIRKGMVDSFVRDRAVTLLGSYDGSLIPYFQDNNKRNIFIESLINTDTDRTGVFCSYDIDKVETDYPNGKVDMIGQTLVDINKSKINFMSYQDTIEEIDGYPETGLDTLGNVTGIGTITTRTSTKTNGRTTGIVSATSGLTTSTPTVTLTSTSGTATINNTILDVVTTASVLTAVPVPGANSAYRIDTLYIDQAGTIAVAQGTVYNAAYGSNEATAVSGGLTYPASMPNNAIVFGYMFRNVVGTGSGATFNIVAAAGPVTSVTVNAAGSGYAPNTAYILTVTGAGTGAIITATTNGSGVFTNGGIVITNAGSGYSGATCTLPSNLLYANTYVPVAVDGSGYVPLVIGTGGSDDIQVQASANNVLDMIFYQTATATKGNYKAWRRVLFFEELATKKILNNSVIIDNAGAKVDLTSALWTDNYTAGTGDKRITLTVGTGVNIRTSPAGGNFVFHYTDNEFTLTSPFVSGNLLGFETRSTVTGTSGYGVTAKLSDFYLDFYNGRINSGDYFYTKMLSATTSLRFVHYSNLAYPNSVGDYIIMSAADASTLGIGIGSNNKHILIQSHPVNAGDYLLTDGEGTAGSVFAPGLVADSYLTGSNIAFKASNLVSTYTTALATDVYDYDAKLYLKMYFVGSNLKADFMADNTLTTIGNIPSSLLSINTTLNVYSGEAAFTQTLEIEQHGSYTITDTKFLIDAVRYPEVKVGDYVKAYIDSPSLQPGEYPKKFARILKKQAWSGNTANNVNYQEITTDVKVDIEIFGSDYQTTRYTTIEDYVDTYKAISLGGFVSQSTSWPDGTEARQSEILDVIGKGTSLYNAIVNKNKFSFRYLVDSFGLGLTAFSKQQLADITGKRKNCIGFINMPSAKSFKQSTNPSFINTDGTLNIEYVKMGGNPESNPAFLYSFAQGSGRDDGRDTVGYFFPYVTVTDNGRPLMFPPAVFAMNTYMRKNNSKISGIYNHTIAAGITDGKILGIGDVEMDIDSEFDLKHFYEMGGNPITYASNTFYIATEFTASISPASSLSYLHSREVLIDLENELYAMLLKYNYKFNTVAIRAKIKREADEICQRFVDRSALYAYENIINETNNTPTLIDAQVGLLETNIEIVKGLAIIVNQINVFGSGALGTSTGFAA